MTSKITATDRWHFLAEQDFPEVATISGEPQYYLVSGVLLLKTSDGEYYVGRCEIVEHEKVWRFYDRDEHELRDVVEWAQILGEEAL